MPKIIEFYLFLKFSNRLERSETIILGILGNLDTLGIQNYDSAVNN